MSGDGISKRSNRKRAVFASKNTLVDSSRRPCHLVVFRLHSTEATGSSSSHAKFATVDLQAAAQCPCLTHFRHAFCRAGHVVRRCSSRKQNSPIRFEALNGCAVLSLKAAMFPTGELQANGGVSEI